MACSSFHGRIDEIPGISVDNFENAVEVMARAYFLSHCHTDHTQGLHTPALLETLEKTGAYIYMSEGTAAVINEENTDGRIKKYIKALKLGTKLITLPKTRNHEELFIDVTLIPAGHSFGSVMFLFSTTTKNILFTGDFRISSSDVPKYKHLHNNQEDPISIDSLYVDTTFIDYRYLNFPKRSTSIEYAVEEIRRWLGRDESNRVALHTSAKYGYEYVFNEIYEKLGLKVYVNKERWTVYSSLSDKILGVTNEEKGTKIHICRNRSENHRHTNCMPQENNHSPYLYIHFSAMKWNNYEMDDSTVRRVSERRLDICFPTHCSRSELIYFVNYFTPKKVVGFPNEYNPKSEEEVENYEIVTKKIKLTSEIDKYVDRKVDSELLKKIFEL